MPQTPSHRAPRWLVAAVAALGAATSIAGCQSGPPQGSSGGRIDPYRSTAADRASSSASGPALLEFSDQVAMALARDLTSIDRIRSSPQRVALELGDLNNRTNTPTSDFEMIQHRIRGQLLKSKLIRDQFLILVDPQRMDREQQRLSGTEGPTARYSPEQTYVLMGDFFESRRGRTRRYYFEFKLTHLASREPVFNEFYDLAQQ